MNISYVSPSVIPSQSANSVHVIHQCAALAARGAGVTLYFKRALPTPDPKKLQAAIESHYGSSLEGIDLVSYYSRIPKGDNLRIALLALFSLIRRKTPELIISRNLYFSFFISLINPGKLVFEHHQIESGLKGRMQGLILVRKEMRTIFISEALKSDVENRFGPVRGIARILPDAAPDGIHPDRKAARDMTAGRWLKDAGFSHSPQVCGYFGQLYPGRGIEIIEGLAGRMSDVVFLVFGGNADEVETRRKKNHLKNLIFAGFIPNKDARMAMQGCDVLLMPYQTKVLIAAQGQDTGRWMSPMKMFEYMASGTPMVVSDLPVLGEVLEDGRNSLLVEASDLNQWETATTRLLNDSELADSIASTAYNQYQERHTWGARAKSILELAACG